ncbi:hypothetical protein JKP88DRAFT_241088 [Tribonema minus]|uniref:Telomere resolvase ResT/TelK catalytic domain-containing protein n=1 Tax=Tribonema minus TaxID=303371 RepID=A0A835Z5G7_9STRA|nr:hypothetical protein JKP88DRAFT_241088 [Tribonema minus]
MRPALLIDVSGLDDDWVSSDESGSEESDASETESGSESDWTEHTDKCNSMSVSSADTGTDSCASDMSVTPLQSTASETHVFFDPVKMYKQLEERMSASMFDACGLEPEDVPPLISIFDEKVGRFTVAQKIAKKLRTTESMLSLALDTIRLTFFADDKVVAMEERTNASKVSKLAILMLESASYNDHEDDLVIKEVELCVEYIVDLLERKKATYLSCVKAAWMAQNIYSDDCVAKMSEIDALLKKKLVGSRGKTREAVKTAIDDYDKFKQLSLKEKVGVQKLLRQEPLTGLEDVDDGILKLPILPQYVRDLHLTKQESDEVARKSMEALAIKSVNSVCVDASDLISKCEKTLKDVKSNAFDLAAAIALTCGRRMTEIFSVGKFEAVEGEERTLAFSGQVKKRFGSHDATNFVPTLAKASVFLDAINRLRVEKSCTGLSNRDVNLKWSNSCQSAARRLLGDDGHFHELRAMYAVIAFNATLPHSYSLNAFVSRVLGHVGLGNSLTYACINVSNLAPAHKFQWSYLNAYGAAPSPKRKPLREVIRK